MITIESLLGEGGRLGQVMKTPEVRPGQVKMAEAIEAAIKEGRSLAVQAGTGTGKSLGALIPAALYAAKQKKKVVIAPHTLALQEQLIQKDIPLLQRLLLPEVELEAATLKGRGNYLCPLKLHDYDKPWGRFEFSSYSLAQQFQKMAEAIAGTGIGERGELPFAVHGEVWAAVQNDSDSCIGAECSHFYSCPYLKAVRQAAKADIVVANQSLVFADLAIKARGEDGVLPAYDVLILDEAHHLEDAATRAWQVCIDRGSFDRAAKALRTLAKALGAKKRGADRYEQYAQAVSMEGANWLASLSEGAVKTASDPGPFIDLAGQIRTELFFFEGAAMTEKQKQALESCLRRLDDLSDQVVQWSKRSRDDWAYWVSVDNHGNRKAEMAPIEVAEILQERLFYKGGPTVICTSATLSEALLQRVGFPAPQVLKVQSPFNYKKQALLYVPRHALEPKNPAYEDYVVAHCRSLVQAAGGRSLILFTSRAMLDRVYDQLAPVFETQGYRTLKQGEATRRELLSIFKTDLTSVLMGLTSFWEGVDVPGEALRCVILTRLPFSVPTEPLAVARAERLTAKGGDPFSEISLPEAILRFQQGFGRLIRTRYDKGVVACLDARFISSSYGLTFRQAVAEVPGSRSLRVVEELLRSEANKAMAAG